MEDDKGVLRDFEEYFESKDLEYLKKKIYLLIEDHEVCFI